MRALVWDGKRAEVVDDRPEPQVAAGTAVVRVHLAGEQVRIEPAARAVVLGDGKLGLLCAQVLPRAGASVTLVGRHAGKLAIGARDRDGPV